jgi:hypothetical protein
MSSKSGRLLIGKTFKIDSSIQLPKKTKNEWFSIYGVFLVYFFNIFNSYKIYYKSEIIIFIKFNKKP